MSEGEIDDGNEDDMEADDDQGANGEIGDDIPMNVVQELAAIEYAKKETDVDGIEQDNVQQVLAGIESIKMPGEEQNATCKAEDAPREVMEPIVERTILVDSSEKIILSKDIPNIIIR